VTGTQSSTGSNPNPFTTVERKDVGITLKIKPQVSEGGGITMSVFQEVSSVDTELQTGNAGLATKKRSIESKVLVDDSQVIVLGGLIEDKISKGQSKVPLLGDLPFIGNLFRYENRRVDKVNLMVFLRPTVLRDSKAAATLTNQRYDYIRNLQDGTGAPAGWALPQLPIVKLPAVSADKPGLSGVVLPAKTPTLAETPAAESPTVKAN
jgi:general secretion pathway protein D